MRIAAVQAAASTDKAANLTKARRLIAGSLARRPNFVVLPEAFMHDFGEPSTQLARVAEPLDGPFVSALVELARAYRLAIAAGMFERSEEPGLAYNTVVVIDVDGKVVGHYRKTHLYDSFGYRESDRLVAGDPAPVVVDVCEMRVGLLTCYDLRFPEMARALVDRGAEVLCVPAAWLRGPLKEDHWETLLRARAIENTCFVVGAGQVGPSYIGRSMVVDPMGFPLASLGADEGVLVADAEKSRLDEVRGTNPALQHRRFSVVPADDAVGSLR